MEILENKNYKKWKRLYSHIPITFRSFLFSFKFFLPIELLKWVMIDKARPRYFHPYGFYFYTGLPGYGKTIALVNQLEEYRNKYGSQILIATNFGYKNEDFAVYDYNDIVKIYDKPIIIGYDEIQNDFDARNWANLDAIFSERITQSRKLNGMMILATAQRFGFVDRRLRQLTSLVYECRTLFNRLTMYRIYEPQIKEKLEDGTYMENASVKTKGFRAFVQSDYIRNLYDSFQILERIKKNMLLSQENGIQIFNQLKHYLKD